MGRQEHGRREFRQIGVGDVEAHVHALVLRMGADPVIREHHVGGGLERMSQRLEWEEIAFLDLLRGQLGQLLPGRYALGQARHGSHHDALAAGHAGAGDGLAVEMEAALHVGVDVGHQLRLLRLAHFRPFVPGHVQNRRLPRGTALAGITPQVERRGLAGF